MLIVSKTVILLAGYYMLGLSVKSSGTKATNRLNKWKEILAIGTNKKSAACFK